MIFRRSWLPWAGSTRSRYSVGAPTFGQWRVHGKGFLGVAPREFRPEAEEWARIADACPVVLGDRARPLRGRGRVGRCGWFGGGHGDPLPGWWLGRRHAERI